MKKSVFFVLFIGIIFGLLAAQTEKSKDIEIEIILHQMIEMKDGVHIAANIYKPAQMSKPLPAIFAFTPYISDEGQERGTFFAQHGYVYVHADVRGRGNSEGEFYPLEKDGMDGAQVVEWIARQTWCDGRVGMRGGSYRGMVQWQTLKHFPPALKTIVPTAAAAPGVDFPMSNNVFTSYVTQWLAFVKGETGNVNLFSDQKFWMSKFYKMYSEHIPFARLAELTGSNEKIFERWISHPYFDKLWKDTAFPDKDYEKIDIPILTITGHFDGDQPGALHYFHHHMEYGSQEAREKHYLLVGPWDHPGTRHPQKELGGLTFGDNAVLDMEKLHLEWYDWVFKGKERPGLLKKRICYYVMNENVWKYAESLDDISNKTQEWYLSSEGGEAGDVFHSGKLVPDAPQGMQKPDTFEYDPLKIMTKDEYFKSRTEAYFLDQRAAFSEDKLIYHSAPLEEALEVAGYVKVRLFIELNVPDTDLAVALYEIRPDGQSIYLAEDFIRARFRESLSRAELIKPGEINEYVFERAYFFARKLEKGSRLRLVVSCLNSPDIEKNYNSGGVVAEETAEDARTAVIKLYHDKDHPSLIIFGDGPGHLKSYQ